MKRLGRLAIALGLATSGLCLMPAPSEAAPCGNFTPILLEDYISVHACVLAFQDPVYVSADVRFPNGEESLTVTVEDDVTICYNVGTGQTFCNVVPLPVAPARADRVAGPASADAVCVPTPSGTTCVDPTGACLVAVYPRVGPATCLKNPIGPIIDPRIQAEPK